MNLLAHADDPPHPYLATLLADAHALVAAVHAGHPTRVDVDDARTASLRATLLLDGSDVDDATIAAVERQPPGGAGGHQAAMPAGVGSWLDALGTQSIDDDTAAEIGAREIRGAAAAFDADDLAAPLRESPREALQQLHGRLVAELVDPSGHGALRTTDQAVLDTSVGRVVYYPVDPAAIESALDALARWLTASTRRPFITAGLVHLELLRIHPFESANGRLARAAARLLLRAEGNDPYRLAQPEIALAANRLTYHERLAATLRRREPSRWLELWLEALTAGLAAQARRLGQIDVDVADRARAFVRQRRARGDDAAQTFSIADYRQNAGVDRDQAEADLAALLLAGHVDRVLGTSGLRFVIRDTAGAGADERSIQASRISPPRTSAGTPPR
ncbi:MAG: Fic family protein [Nitriliruptoraceae bacterium]